MRKLFVIFMILISGVLPLFAQSLEEALKDCPELESIFVYPCDITTPIDKITAAEFESSLKENGIEYKVVDLGAMGQVFSITPKKLSITDVRISKILISIGSNFCTAIYESVPQQDYDTLKTTFNKELSNYPNIGNEIMPLYQVTKDQAIGLGFADNDEIAVLIMADIKNVNAFLTGLTGTSNK